MGEKMNQVRLFIGNQEVATGVSEMELTSSAEQPEQEDNCDWSQPPSFTITGKVGISPEDHERMMRQFLFTRKERKQMFHDVTHGYYLVFQVMITDEEGNDREVLVKIDRPSHLRQLLAHIHNARCPYTALPKR